MLYSLYHMREQYDNGLWVTLPFFPCHLFSSQEQDLYSRLWSLNMVAMMEAARTAETLVLLFQTIWHQPPENSSLHSHNNYCCSRLSKIMLLSYMIFCIDSLLFYTTNIMNFISLLGGFICCIVCLCNLSINDHIEHEVKYLSVCVFCERLVCMLHVV